MDKSRVIESVVGFLLDSKIDDAKTLIRDVYPHKNIVPEKRTYTMREKMEQFLDDGFVDRYSGERLINPGVLKIITHYCAEEFPYDAHWKMTKTHIAYWDMIPTVDHIVPISQGGVDNRTNWATTSMRNNSIKSNYSLEDINWKLFPKGDLNVWDGLSEFLLKLVDNDLSLTEDMYIYKWYKITKEMLSK